MYGYVLENYYIVSVLIFLLFGLIKGYLFPNEFYTSVFKI